MFVLQKFILQIKHFLKIKVSIIIPSIIGGVGVLSLAIYTIYAVVLNNNLHTLTSQKTKTDKQLAHVAKELKDLKNQDQYKRNEELQKTIKNIEDTYSKSVSLYEKLLDLKLQVKDTSDLDKLLAESISFLSKRNYASAGADLDTLAANIQKENDKLVAATAANVPANVPSSNAAPGSGFSQQSVNTDAGSFVVDIIAADLNSTRVIVDTASDGDCSNNCPVLPLATYVGRSGAFAGINGTFFCPTEYPSCAGKTNSFDTLLMNKNKVYFNSANNVYSTVPLVYFTGNTMGVRGHSSDWGRDTGVDSVIAMQPLLVSGGNIVYSDSSDPKFTSKGTRGFIAAKGNTVYIGDVLNATMGESAKVMKALGMDNALNLDEGGSTALWFGGYKLGPGRNIPNAVLFVHK